MERKIRAIRASFWGFVVTVGLAGLLALGMTPPNSSVDYGHDSVQVEP